MKTNIRMAGSSYVGSEGMIWTGEMPLLITVSPNMRIVDDRIDGGRSFAVSQVAFHLGAGDDNTWQTVFVIPTSRDKVLNG